MPVKKPSKPPKSTKSKSKKSSSRGRSTSTSTRGKSTSRKSTPAPQPQPTFWSSLSTDRKLDLVGVAMALVGVVTLLSLVTTNRGNLTSGLVRMLSLLFGWGVYVLPVALILVGGWLVLRNVDRLPSLSIERGTGILLLALNLLTSAHWLAGDPELASQIAAEGSGGGYFGNLFLTLLYTGLGTGGTFIALLAWLVIAVLMTFDISVQELGDFFRPLFIRLNQAFEAFQSHLKSRLASSQSVSTSLQEDFIPINRPGEPVQGEANQPGTPTVRIGVPSAGQILWKLPPMQDILDSGLSPEVNEEFIQQRVQLIEETLSAFGAPAQVIEINRGPTITQFGVEPQFIESRTGRTKVRVSKIVSLADDLALALAAPRIRIQAPVPGRGYIGIEVPNEQMTLVALRDILESEPFKRNHKSMRIALGRDVAGYPVTADLTAMPHLLIAGTTGSGKSVCVNAILTCLLLNNTPDDLRLVLVDPKRVELTGYNGVPHLLAPVVVELERVIGALQWMTREMDRRYHLFAKNGARNIDDYNNRMQNQPGKKLPYLVVVIDELADLMLLAPDETERTITRLAQLARATGIHMILATQRPSVDVVTGLIKANFPARIAFAVASGVDSRVILDQPGAERLLGRGDMLYQAPDAPAAVRLQGVFVSEFENQQLVEFWRGQAGQVSAFAIPGRPVDTIPASIPLKQAPLWDQMETDEPDDPLYTEAIDLVRREGRASVSMLQRRLRIGYTRAARLMDNMEDKGIVGPPEGATGVRPVLDYGPAAPPKEE